MESKILRVMHFLHQTQHQQGSRKVVPALLAIVILVITNSAATKSKELALCLLVFQGDWGEWSPIILPIIPAI